MENKYKKHHKTNLLSLKKVYNNSDSDNKVSTTVEIPPKKCKIDENIPQTSSRLDSDQITLSFDVNSYFLNDLSQFQTETIPSQDDDVFISSEFLLTCPEWDKNTVTSTVDVKNDETLSQFYESSQVLKQIETVISSNEFETPLNPINKDSNSKIKVKEVLKNVKDNDDVINESISNEISLLFKSSQYKKEVSSLFNQLETTILQLNEGQDTSLQNLNISEQILSNSVVSHDWDNDSIVQWNKQPQTSESKIGDKIKERLLKNLEKTTIEIQQNEQQTDNDFQEIGPYYGLPIKVKELIQQYKGIDKLYDWQDECLKLEAIKNRKNLIYALPTSGGKTLVSEILIFREILCRRKNAIFVLPYVSIVQEKVWALSPFALALNFLVEEYAAGKGTLPPRRRRVKRSVYVATIEKALGLVNALLETGRLGELGLVVVDELHLLGEGSRGATLEMLLTKIMWAKSNGENIHIVGMSATIGNLPELCKFLNSDTYTQDFRPVELKEYVKCGSQLSQINRHAKCVEDLFSEPKTIDFQYSEEVAKIDPDRLTGLVMEIIPNSSCLVFCASKKNCENVSLLLCRVMPKKNLLKHKITEKTHLLDNLYSEGGICPTLKRTIPFGVAYHHSGLTADERRLIEDAFRVGTICVICCTSTLAAGVNLPARRVILRSPYVGREFLTLARYKQMSGRAGRTGLGEIGESILLCEARDLQKVTQMLSQPMENVNSQLIFDDFRGLRDLILSCIALGTANTRKQIRCFIKMSLLAVQKSENEVKMATDECISQLFKLAAIQLEIDRDKIAEKDTSVFLQDSLVSNSPQITQPDKKRITISSDSRLVISKLGLAATKGGLDLDTAHILYDDLICAQSSLVLLNCLHLLYLVTPYELSRQTHPNLQTYYSIYLELGQKELKTARIIGIDEACCQNMMTGRKIKLKERILNRFYLTLILYELWEGKDIFLVADKFQVSRGLVQQLMLSASSFSSNVVRFCEQLEELWCFASLLSGLGQRLQHCASRDLEPLLQLPSVKQARAKQLLKAGYKSLQDLAVANPQELVDKVEFMSRRVANQLIASAKLLLLEKVENLREEAQDVLDGIGSQ